MPVHASPPDRLDVSLPSECKLGPRFGYNLEINQSIGPSCRDPDVAHWQVSDMVGLADTAFVALAHAPEKLALILFVSGPRHR
jgi:hypothetical protein